MLELCILCKLTELLLNKLGDFLILCLDCKLFALFTVESELPLLLLELVLELLVELLLELLLLIMVLGCLLVWGLFDLLMEESV